MKSNSNSSKSCYEQSSFIGKLFFSHIFPLFLRGYQRNGLSQDDLGRCPEQDEVESHAERLSRNWNRNLTRKNPNFYWTLICTFAPDFIIPILFALFEEAFIRIAQPLCLGVVIRYFANDAEVTYEEACYSAIAVCLCSGLFNLIYYSRDFLTSRIGMRARSACCSLMYQKTLRLSQASLSKTAVGQIVNIMSNDVNRIDQIVSVLPYIIVGPIQTALATYIVWTYLGISSLLATGFLLLLVPVQFGMAKLYSQIREETSQSVRRVSKTATLTDSRLRFMHEIISGMRVIKMYCWEKSFADRIAQTRKSEVKKIRSGCYIRALSMSISALASQIMMFSSFLAFVLIGNFGLTAEAVFVSMALFNALKRSMTQYFPFAIRTAAELLISCKRMENFLMLDEFKSNKPDKIDNNLNEDEDELFSAWTNNNYNRPKPAQLVVNNICAKWNSDITEPTLKNVSLSLEPGDLLVVIGPVGSGKSSLLMTMLDELPLKNGEILREGQLSYAGQESWTFNDSVYNNILLGLDYKPVRYQKVVEACALAKDIELWPFGDQTLVGEKGVQLSGGQKARIELARAVYRNADIYLMDDPLSAVDATVADHIFEKCILGHLRNKIRVLVTHQIQFIQKATKILVLKDGQSLAFGSYDELKDLGIDFVSLLAESENEEQAVDTKSLITTFAPTKDVGSLKIVEKTKIKKEESQRGSIKGHVYMDYIRAGASIPMFTLMVVFTVLSQAIMHGSELFLSAWTNKNQLSEVQQDQKTDILIYSALVGALFVTTIIRAITFFDICLTASENLHNKIFSRLLRTPVTFLDTNPVGRIMNRFSKDQGLVDEALVTSAFNLNLQLFLVFGIIVTICIVNLTMLFPSIVLVILSFYVRRFYIVAARDLRRFEGIARSPVFSHIGTTINGLVSIRAFGTKQSFQKQFNSFQNDHNSAYFLVVGSSNGLGVMVEWICFFYLSTVIALTMLIPDLPGGSAGLVISSAIGLSSFISWTVRQTANFESQMTSVERIVEYQNLEQEASPETNPELKLDKEWPAHGEIQFDNLSLFYDNKKESVLKKLNFVVSAREKVGIVGRTGAGKSSMITALFRLAEPIGVIRIDGVDIQTIGLNDLRKKISIIPQDPVIYSGTIRYNLDPFNQYSDSSLWEVLDQVQLKTTVTNLEGQLESQLNDSGSNLSVGQRQLVCLARAILRRNQILVLDEATANIDHQTDSLIQSTLRSHFGSCTVLTIAHRLNTIIDSDRVLVLDAGQIVEFDAPYLLLQRQNAFYEMCLKTGPKMYAHLFRAAQLAYQNRSNNTLS